MIRKIVITRSGFSWRRALSCLAAAKARGVRLGRTSAEILAPRHRAEALDRASQIAPMFQELQREGLSLRGIAAEMIKRKVQTPRGGTWHPQLVKRIVQRLEGHVL